MAVDLKRAQREAAQSFKKAHNEHSTTITALYWPKKGTPAQSEKKGKYPLTVGWRILIFIQGRDYLVPLLMSTSTNSRSE